ncbi:hypothetical protein [Maridesulfovibrio sp.]|uniref:hypothetical protein n=1 Tax=unclassified Maridesulfovibrio TaxID=2794999 RepID=UPI003AFFA801
MNRAQDKLDLIYIGYHPRTLDGSSPKSRSLSESMALMEDYNKTHDEERFRAEVVQVAYTDLCAVAVMETNMDRVWQYL